MKTARPECVCPSPSRDHVKNMRFMGGTKMASEATGNVTGIQYCGHKEGFL
jgi:hypothetical protein